MKLTIRCTRFFFSFTFPVQLVLDILADAATTEISVRDVVQLSLRKFSSRGQNDKTIMSTELSHHSLQNSGSIALTGHLSSFCKHLKTIWLHVNIWCYDICFHVQNKSNRECGAWREMPRNRIASFNRLPKAQVRTTDMLPSPSPRHMLRK